MKNNTFAGLITMLMTLAVSPAFSTSGTDCEVKVGETNGNTENTLTLGNVVSDTGTNVAFPISLTNQDEITALQMDLYLPEGISIINCEEGGALIEMGNRVSNSHTVCYKMTDGRCRIICYSTKNTAFSGNSGELLNIMLNVSANMKDGDYEISATNIELSDNAGTAYIGQDINGFVTVNTDNGDASNISFPSFDGNVYSEGYDLSGRLIDVSRAKNGVYIVNDMKVYIVPDE